MPFHVKSFLALLFTTGNIAVLGGHGPPAPWIRSWFVVASNVLIFKYSPMYVIIAVEKSILSL